MEICSGGSSTRGRSFRAIDHGLKGRQQAEQIDFELRLVVVARDVGHPLVGALPLSGANLLALVQQAGGRLEFLVLEEPADERIPRILRLALHPGRRFRPRQQHPGLDVNQRRRHDQELARHVQVELLHELNRVQVLRGDERDRDVVDADLVLPDEVQQQVERPLEVIEPDGDRVDRRFEIRMVHAIGT